MAFKLKKNGAKELSKFLESADRITREYTKEFMLPTINSLKTDVVFDGKNVLIKELKVSELAPDIVSGSKNRVLNYLLGSNNYLVVYNKPIQSRLQYIESHPLLQKLFNAKEIAKDMCKTTVGLIIFDKKFEYSPSRL